MSVRPFDRIEAMEAFISQLTFFLRHNIVTVFPLIYFATILGGNILAFTIFWVGFAANFGGWRIVAVFGVVALAEVSGDLVWFSIGRLSRNTAFGNWVKSHLPGHDHVEDILHSQGKKLLYLSKFAYGSAAVVIFSLGWSGMRLKTFLKNSALSVVIGLPVVFFLAYGLFSGLSPITAVTQFKHLEILFLIAIVSFFVLQWLLSKAARIIFGTTADG